MNLPIVAYGDPVLKKKAEEIDQDYPKLDKLIEDMFDTMYNAHGVGLAAPQIGKSIRLFVVDASPVGEGEDAEGCLSIPNIREEVKRKSRVLIEYYDENWDLYEEELEGFAARVVQHEYDHIEGTLFLDRISPFKRTLLKGKLADISKGNVDVRYRMKFPKK
jgi:peptide deformylase